MSEGRVIQVLTQLPVHSPHIFRRGWCKGGLNVPSDELLRAALIEAEAIVSSRSLTSKTMSHWQRTDDGASTWINAAQEELVEISTTGQMVSEE